MNMLVAGEWRTDAYETTNEEGAFKRQTTTFRDHIEDDPDARFQPESGRYHLYVCRACPWAHRTLIVRQLAGLEDAISVDYVDPYRDEGGWQFTPSKAGCTPDTVNGAESLREVYLAADPDMTGRVTVPVLWDTHEETIVNNESKEIMRMLDTAFDAGRDAVDLYPAGYREEVDRIIEAIYEPINNGVYRAALAESQAAYDAAVEDLFGALDHWESVLADQPSLAGDRLTEADVAMYTTLIRFDRVYYTTPATLRSVRPQLDDYRAEEWRRIADYEHLSAYLQRLFDIPAFEATTDFAHIVEHYGSPGSPDGFDPEPVDHAEPVV